MSVQQIGRADYLNLGDWNALCTLCGRKRKASEMVQVEQGIPGAGQYMCPEHRWHRNPQDFVRGMPDDMTPPWVQTNPDIFIEFCTPNQETALPDYGVADCMIADYISPAFDPADTGDA